jgi:hypothetical protein
MLSFERTSTRRSVNAEKGQSLLEMCFGFVVLLMIVSGVIDLGRLYFSYVALEDAAGEAALFMSINPKCPNDAVISGEAVADDGTNGEDCDPPDNGIWRARNAGGSPGLSLVEWTSVKTDITCFEGISTIKRTSCDLGEVGDLIEVKMVYRFTLLSPYIPQIAGNSYIDLTSTAQQLILVEP